MDKFILLTGGARSGKSSFAEKQALQKRGSVVYIATAIPFDEGMRNRIKKHRSSRPAEWTTIEKYKNFKELENNNSFLESDLVLIDCITLMVSNLLLDSCLDFGECSMEEIAELEDKVFLEIKELLDIVVNYDKDLIMVTNEVGMGLVPPFRLGSIFRDIAGRVNQYLAGEAEEVFLLVSGIPVKIK